MDRIEFEGKTRFSGVTSSSVWRPNFLFVVDVENSDGCETRVHVIIRPFARWVLTAPVLKMKDAIVPFVTAMKAGGRADVKSA